MKRSNNFQFTSRICMFFALIISACKGDIDIPTATPLIPQDTISVPPPTQTLKPSSSPLAATINSVPPPTKTRQPIPIHLIPTRVDNPGAWSFLDPKDPSLPELFIPQAQGFRLRTDWKLGAITYLYEWGGIGGPLITYQTVRWEDNSYNIAGRGVPADLVDAIVNSLQELYPFPTPISSLTHTDDYPRWSVELVGRDGMRMELFSESNTDGAVPWNVYYNGRIFTSWNSKILPALTRLFDIQFGIPAASFYPGGSPDNLPLAAIDWPPQLRNSFAGLLPISNRFSYQYNSNGRIEGRIDREYPLVNFGTKANGNITDLQKVEIQLGGDRIYCPGEAAEEKNPKAALYGSPATHSVWKFICSPVAHPISPGTHVPIAMTFKTDTGELIATYGELLIRTFNDHQKLFVPLPENFQKALRMNSKLSDLLRDHIVEINEFLGDVDLQKASPFDGLDAQVDLFGQLALNHQAIRYMISSPIKIDHGEVVQWDLDRQKLAKLIEEIIDIPFVQKALSVNPSPTLNIWYAELSKIEPDFPYSVIKYPPSFYYQLPNCPALYAGVAVPNLQEPLIGFGFNQSGDIRATQFLLIDQKAIPIQLDVSPADLQTELLPILTPLELQMAGRPPIGRISMTSDELSFPYKIAIWVIWDPQTITGKDISSYKDQINAINIPHEEIENGYDFVDSTFVVSADGALNIESCTP
jgi:hypothetical protein